jgi:hypothetical protein
MGAGVWRSGGGERDVHIFVRVEYFGERGVEEVAGTELGVDHFGGRPNIRSTGSFGARADYSLNGVSQDLLYGFTAKLPPTGLPRDSVHFAANPLS